MLDPTDRTRLALALSAAGTRADPDTLDRVADKLHKLRWDYFHRRGRRVPGGGGRPSKELLEVNAALRKWLKETPGARDGLSFNMEQCLIHQFDEVKMYAMIWLRDATTQAIERLESDRDRYRTEDPETTLQLELVYLYRDETGSQGITDGGPAHRFVIECAAIVCDTVVVPGVGFRQLMQKADARRKKSRDGPRKNDP
jgi:hypothetical protein